MQHGCNIEVDEILVDDFSRKSGKVDLWLYAWLQSRSDDVNVVNLTREGGNVANSWVLRAVRETCYIGGETMGSYTDCTFFLLALLPSGTTVLSTESLGRFEPEAPI